jgi:citrate lyase subunit beta/citryl-CoA lyase
MSTPTLRMRSWLFAPGDSDRKMEKATQSAADIVLLDLEDAVSEGEKPKAREMVAAFIKANPENRHRLWVRINPLDGPHTLADLVGVMPALPGGIMFPKTRGPQDMLALDNYLSALETAYGGEVGSTKVIPLVTETAEGMFTTGAYKGAPRLAAMTWGAEDLADSIGASNNRNPDGSYAFTYELARSLTVLGAATAGVPAIETIQADFKDLEGLRKRATMVRQAGYRGMLSIHPAQVDVINEAFLPTPEEIAQAQEIVDLFAANPGVGAIGYKGGMVDRPYLARAQQLLALAGR